MREVLKRRIILKGEKGKTAGATSKKEKNEILKRIRKINRKKRSASYNFCAWSSRSARDIFGKKN